MWNRAWKLFNSQLRNQNRACSKIRYFRRKVIWNFLYFLIGLEVSPYPDERFFQGCRTRKSPRTKPAFLFFLTWPWMPMTYLSSTSTASQQSLLMTSSPPVRILRNFHFWTLHHHNAFGHQRSCIAYELQYLLTSPYSSEGLTSFSVEESIDCFHGDSKFLNVCWLSSTLDKIYLFIIVSSD